MQLLKITINADLGYVYDCGIFVHTSRRDLLLADVPQIASVAA